MGDEYIKRRDVLIKLEIAYDMARLDQKLPISDLQHEVNLIKSADVQPIKHGRWIWVKDYRDCEGDIYSQYKCSCCDFCVGGVYSVKDLTHFCGNCGARMDLDE